MKRKDHITLGDIYGNMLKDVKVIKENNAQENINKSKKIPKMSKNAFSEKNPLTKGGPQEEGGYHKALNDDYCGCDEDEQTYLNQSAIEEIEEKLKNPNLSEKKRQSMERELSRLKKGAQNVEAEEFVEESKKIARKRLNTFMTKKSTFDKLFESLMGGNFGEDQDNAQEIDALDLGDAPTDDEFGGEDDLDGEGDQVTVTLSRDLAQQLHDVLMGVLGDEGEDLDFGDDEDLDLGDEDFDDQEDEFDDQEDEETIGASNSKDGGHSLQQKSNRVSGRPQPKGQGTKVVGTTDKVGNDGDHGHALHGAKQPNMGKQNKVSDIRQSEDFFR